MDIFCLPSNIQGYQVTLELQWVIRIPHHFADEPMDYMKQYKKIQESLTHFTE